MLFSRRDRWLSASLGALACGGGNAVAQNTPKTPAAPPHVHGAADAALLEAAQGCVAKGQACIGHCLGMIAAGDTSMSGCLRAVHDMHAVLEALVATTASGSRHLAALTKVAIELCRDCETECRKHADKHAVCRECADACARTIAVGQKA